MLFLPAESFLAAGLDADGSLIEYAAERGVVLASPTTLIALLRTVAHGWRHESLADQAREIHRMGRDLHDRLRTMGAHLGKLGRSLDTAVGAYNQTVGSWESRVLVAARRFEDLDVTDDVLESPRQVETAVRAVGSVHPPASARRGRRGGGRAYGGPVSEARARVGLPLCAHRHTAAYAAGPSRPAVAPRRRGCTCTAVRFRTQPATVGPRVTTSDRRPHPCRPARGSA